MNLIENISFFMYLNYSRVYKMEVELLISDSNQKLQILSVQNYMKIEKKNLSVFLKTIIFHSFTELVINKNYTFVVLGFNLDIYIYI